MNRVVVTGLGVVLLVLPVALVLWWIGSAKDRLVQVEAAAKPTTQQVAVAAAANETYCTPDLQKILRRVLQSCGLIKSGGGRGCQPVEARQVATMSGSDFNALFAPMASRGGIVQFDNDSAELDPRGKQLIDKLYADRRGASYFLVVARASPIGSVEHNRELSRQRAEAVMSYLQSTYQDPDLDQQVGLLWLGEEYAQLQQQFCSWQRSGPSTECTDEELNRSAFITWIDCRL